MDPSDISLKYKISDDHLENHFFNYDLSRKIKQKKGTFDLVLSTNSFAHIDDVLSVVKGVRNLLSDTGSFVFEVHWVGTLIKKFQFPFIYHEHLYYYSLKALSMLLEKEKLKVYDIEEIRNHGGSIRVYACKDGRQVSNSVEEFKVKEENLGLYSFESYQSFSLKIDNYKKEFKKLLTSLKKKGKRLVGYGASGQSTTFLNILGIDSSLIDFVVDDSPLKVGGYCPGSHFEIKSKEAINEDTDVVIIFAYTFLNDILKNIGTCSYIVPLPTINYVKQ